MTGSVSVLPTLWFGNASSTPTELTIREGEQVLGRAADADLCLSETFVSTHHARLTWQKGQLKVLDLNSTNGTLVNGVPVVGWTTLTDGDVIEFGGIEAVVELPKIINLDQPSDSFPPPPPQHDTRVTDEIPKIEPRTTVETTDTDHPETAPADPPAIGHQLPDDLPTPTTGRAAVTLPPTPPTGITISDIEAVTEGYGDFDPGAFGTVNPSLSEPLGGHPESVRGQASDWRRMGGNAGRSDDYDRPPPPFNRDGVSPIVIIVAVALLVFIILAAVFFA